MTRLNRKKKKKVKLSQYLKFTSEIRILVI